MAVVDLHLHTRASDGRLTPTELIDLVASRGLKTIAVTDHDSTEGLDEAIEAAKAYPELSVIPGVELSTDIPGNEIHVLAYFIQHTDARLQETLKKFRAGRLQRGKRMVEKLRELGVEIEWQRVQEIAGDGAVGRPHIALALVEKGYVSLPNEAFSKYIGRNGPAYVEREKLTPPEATSLIRRWGGAPVLAHPAEITDLDDTLEELKAAGLAGMEVNYAQYSEQKIQELAEVAARHGLLPCGGSDYHGLGNPGEPLPGIVGPPPEVVERLGKLATGTASAGP
jgi:predicted metal-dependent phosphoesterase TrpH